MTHEDELRVREIIAEGNSGCVEVLFVFLVMVALGVFLLPYRSPY